MSRLLIALVCGAVFGFGLSLATMTQPEVVLAFLRFTDFGLLLVLGGAVIVALIAYQIGPRLLPRPIAGRIFEKRQTPFSHRTMIGAAIFGAGWGLCGVCPGPAIAGVGLGNLDLLWALGGIFIGAWLQARFFGSSDAQTR